MVAQQNQEQAKIKTLVAKIEQQPEDWQAYADLVSMLSITGNYIQAEELGLKSLGLFAKNTEAVAYLNYAIGSNYYNAGSYEQAQKYFQQVDLAPLKHDATMMQAQDWYAQKKYHQALAFAMTGTEQDATDTEAFILLGQIWLALGQFSDAKKAFDQAFVLDKNNFSANFGRGMLAMAEQVTDNHWLQQAKKIDTDEYQAQAQQLDDLLNVMTGGEANDASASK